MIPRLLEPDVDVQRYDREHVLLTVRSRRADREQMELELVLEDAALLELAAHAAKPAADAAE